MCAYPPPVSSPALLGRLFFFPPWWGLGNVGGDTGFLSAKILCMSSFRTPMWPWLWSSFLPQRDPQKHFFVYICPKFETDFWLIFLVFIATLKIKTRVYIRNHFQKLRFKNRTDRAPKVFMCLMCPISLNSHNIWIVGPGFMSMCIRWIFQGPLRGLGGDLHLAVITLELFYSLCVYQFLT